MSERENGYIGPGKLVCKYHLQLQPWTYCKLYTSSLVNQVLLSIVSTLYHWYTFQAQLHHCVALPVVAAYIPIQTRNKAMFSWLQN
jgi:hypothetical protein